MSKNIFRTFFFVFFAFAVISVSGQSAQSYMQDGLRKYREGDYVAAIKSFQQVVRINSNYPGVYEYAGNAYFILQDFVRADKAYTIALEKKYQKNLRRKNTRIYRQGNITILEPDPDELSASAYAMIYNNRGAARLFQGRELDAQRDFNEAIRLDSDLKIVQQNLQNLREGNYQIDRLDNNSSSNDRNNTTSRLSDRGQGGWSGNTDYFGTRPVDNLRSVNIREQRENAIDLREIRAKNQSDDGNFISDMFKTKPFESRRVPRKGKLYKSPPVGATSHNYITIESIRITQSSTYVNFKVVNREGKSYFVSLAPRDIEKATFMITDRTGSKKNTFKMVNVSGISLYPQTSRLDPQTAILFTIEFPKIPDTMGYINIVEGSLQTGLEWNFYNVDLTK
ncbi:MAG: hypothetical protein KDE26_01280 [Bacteroidetes bacterium]|nr:hypothetical protein [Bacteroidota bacterium]MCB0841875.1 hypothetical protein [Bacteroidota bacterium]